MGYRCDECGCEICREEYTDLMGMCQNCYEHTVMDDYSWGAHEDESL